MILRKNSQEVKEIVSRSLNLEEYIPKVREIIENVRRCGDKALIEYTRIFDKVEIDSVELKFSIIKKLSSQVSSDFKMSVGKVVDSIFTFYECFEFKNIETTFRNVKRIVKWTPISKVGIYVPKNYVSTALMTIIPAKIAKVKSISIATPPLSNGLISPEMAYILDYLNVDVVYRVGGAQAIAALAYGTETVQKVDKIVGPGNIYVQTAKLLVSTQVGIDGFEGPTEIVMYIDDPDKIESAVLDLLAQLEHGISSIGVVISMREELLRTFLKKLSSTYSNDLGKYYLIHVNDVNEAVELINDLAPEHLVVYSNDAWRIASRVENVGVVSINTPSPFLDYAAGISHVLPTKSPLCLQKSRNLNTIEKV
ncbi:MAG: histidinol dehydrogenase [Thermoprotei archaeon ex4572_64]|nr:MAG: histidinol dehydrogenase [Thermoprotei archaeon ex4572_64]